MTSTRKPQRKLRVPKLRSLEAHALEDEQFSLRVFRNRNKYTRKGRDNDRKSIEFSVTDGE